MESGPITGKKANSSRKRRAKDNKVAAPPKKRKGKLENLSSMPLDVLFEILSHLLPPDLLKLARLSKEFRQILMNRSSMSVWKAARFNAHELPDPPADMSEPAWAHLAFTPLCHICGTATVRKIDWALRKRICKACSFRNLLVVRPGDPVAALLPARTTREGEQFSFIPQYSALLDERSLLEDKPDELKVFDEKKRLLLVEILAHEQLCIAWEQKCSEDKSNERDSLRQQRYRAITDKLRSLGWDKELDLLFVRLKLSEHKLVNQPTRLTPRIWSNIEEPLLEFMQECRAYRLNLERTKFENDRKAVAVSVLRKFKIQQLPYTELMPSSVDFCEFDVVKAVLRQPKDVLVDESSFHELVPLLPRMFDEWRTQKVADLKEVLEKATPAGTLDLAIAVFDCPQCLGMTARPSTSLEYYPEVLMHECTTVGEYAPGFHAPDDVTIKLTKYAGPYTRHGRHAWRTANLFVSPKNVGAVKHVVCAAGLDPMVATVEEMDRGEMYFICETCTSDDEPFGVAFGWRAAVKHLLGVHSYDLSFAENLARTSRGERYRDPDVFDFGAIKWKTISAASISQLDLKHSPTDIKRWRCVHCMDLPSETCPETLQNIKAHLSTLHQIVSPIEDEDYFTPFPPKFESISSDHIVMEYKDFLTLRMTL